MPDGPLIRRISRERLFRIFKDPDLVKLFEDVLYAVGTTLPDVAQEVQANLDLHVADTTDAHQASAIGSTPSGGITANNVQGAIVEIATALGLLGTMSTQAASSVAITGGTISGGTIGLASGSLGYATGNGGGVAQITSKATGVTLNKPSGEIVMDAAALAADTAVTFTLTNSTIAAGDLIVINHVAGGTFGAYTCDARAAAGSAEIMLRNLTAGSLSEAVVLGFAVIKGATS